MTNKIIKNLLRMRVKYLIKNSFQLAEMSIKRSNGSAKLDFAVNFIAKKTIMIPYFKKLLKEILLEEFAEYSELVNKMIIREPIRI